MTDDRKHARLSPSGAHGWLNCAGWESDPTGSIYADEGTAAHLLATWCFEQARDASAFLGRVITVNGNDFEVDDEMAEAVQLYVDRVRQYAGSISPSGLYKQIHTLLVEQRVPIGHVTGEDGAEGTSDAVILTADGAEIQVHDLKYGKGNRVDAEQNPQLMLYALGALEAVALTGFEPQRVRCVIHQPRLDHLSEWDCTIDELLTFVGRVEQRATTINPSEKACQWCRKSGACAEQRAYLEAQIGADFDALPAAVPETDTALDALYPNLGMLEDFIKAARAKIEARLFSGARFTTCKLVAGKKGARKWSDAEAAEQAMKSMRLKSEEMYTRKLVSPTQAEKVLKEAPKRWERLVPLITQADGKASVAPMSDKRPALAVAKPEDDFEVLTDPKEVTA